MVAVETYACVLINIIETGKTHGAISTTLQQMALKLASDPKLLIGILQSTLKVAYNL